jgi:hypothetical protein
VRFVKEFVALDGNILVSVDDMRDKCGILPDSYPPPPPPPPPLIVWLGAHLEFPT